MDISQKDLGLLIALDVLLAEESVSSAAERLGLSQPAMSAQLRRLRVLFNDPLLSPSGRRLVATTRALELKANLRQHLEALDALVRDTRAFEPATAKKTFRIIATDYGHAALAPALARRITADAPSVRLACLPFAPRTVWQALEDDEADVALVTGLSLPEAKFAPGFEEDFCVIQRKQHPLGTGPMSLDAFCSVEHVLVSPEGGGFIGAADRTLARLGYRRRVAVSLPSFLLAPALVAGTDYICLLPRRLARIFSDVVDIAEPPFPSPVFELNLVWHPRRQHDPAHVWLREQVRETFAVA